MQAKKRLSLVVAIILSLQLILPIWSNDNEVSAATTGPNIVSLSPADNTSNVPTNGVFKVTFDENIKKSDLSKKVQIYNYNTSNLVKEYSMNDSKITVSNNVLTIDAKTVRLDKSVEHYILIEAGAVANVSNGALFGGITNATQWNFLTAATDEVDRDRPIILTNELVGLCSTNVSTCTSTISITGSLQFVFDEDVYVSGGNIVLSSSGDNRPISVLSSEVQGSGSNKITLSPSTPFMPSTTYTISIANTSIVDGSGNYYAGGSWKFTTQASPVQLTGQEPLPGQSLNGSINKLVLNFDQGVQGSTNKKLIIRRVSDNFAVFEKVTTDRDFAYSNGNKTVTVNTGNTIANNSSYYVMIESGAFSLSNNASAIYYGIHGATDWVFSTSYGTDTRPPSFTMTPTRASTTASVKEKIVLTFDENVFVNSGNIEVREFNSGALYRSIPVTSTRVTGGGSKVITIDPHMAVSANREEVKSFSLAMKYYVTFSNNAFIDVAGNQFSKQSTNNYYYFQVATTSAVTPQIQSISPSNGTTTVSTDRNIAQFKAAFDKSIIIDNYASNSVTFIPVSSNYDTINGVLEYDRENAKGIIIQPVSDLREDTDYYINISDNAIMDVNGNYFVGIQNEYQWRFKTIGGDKTAPVVTKAEVSGKEIRLIYNEQLKEGLKPSVASFYVTIAGLARNIAKIEIKDTMVVLTLDTTVNSGQNVMISYTKPIDGQIRDLSGNQAAGFANQTVNNGFTNSVPTVTSSTYSGSSVTLTFSESLRSVPSLAYTRFIVTVNNTIYVVTGISGSGDRVTLSLNSSIPSNATVKVSYTSGTYPITGAVNDVASFNITIGKNGTTVDNAIPTIQSIKSSGSSLILNYSENLQSTSAPNANQFSVFVNNSIRTVSKVSINGNNVILTFSKNFSTTDVINVTYIASGTKVLDADNNAAISFVSMLANVDDSENVGAVSLQGAILKGDTITLNFSGRLDSSSVPPTSQFLVRIANNSRVVSSVNISGSQLIIKLGASAKANDTGVISYFDTTPNNSLKSSSGVELGTFTNFALANQTTILDILSDEFSSTDEGILLKLTTATTSTDQTPSNRPATRYTINNVKIATAIGAYADSGVKKGNLVFEVPTGQNGAIVAIPVLSLDYAKSKGDYTFIIKQGDISYEIPISSIDVTAASRAVGGNMNSNVIRFAFEEGRTSATTSLETAINRSGATIVEGPFVFDMTVVNGTSSGEVKVLGNITRKVQSSANITYSNTTAVYYDEGISAISAVPTTFSGNNGTTTITFKRPGNSAYAIVKSNKTYTDTTSHWAYNSITIMARKFVIEGHSTTNFNPQASITRGEFATYIAKGLGLSTNKAAAKKFKDVNSDTVMGGYIGAAVDAGIVSGVSSTSFAPNSYITRQDMALMMIRAASYAGLSTTLSSSADSILVGYNDKSQLSSYAKTGVATAIDLGIISGTTTTKLSPKQNATRVEGTLMIMRLLKKTDSLQY